MYMLSLQYSAIFFFYSSSFLISEILFAVSINASLKSADTMLAFIVIILRLEFFRGEHMTIFIVIRRSKSLLIMEFFLKLMFKAIHSCETFFEIMLHISFDTLESISKTSNFIIIKSERLLSKRLWLWLSLECINNMILMMMILMFMCFQL